MMVGAGIGALTAKMQGKNMLTGALMGGALGGAGSAIGGAAAAGGAAGAGAGVVGNTAATGLMAGNALGAGGMATAGGMSTLGLGTAAGSGAAGLGGLATSIPETAGGYSDLLGGDSMLQNYDMGMGGVESNLNSFTPTETALNIDKYGPLTGPTEAERNINAFGPLTGTQSNGYVPAQMDAETAANIKQYGALEAPVPEESGMFGDGLLGKGVDYISDGFNDMSAFNKASLGLSGYKALNQPEPQVIIPKLPPIDNRPPPSVGSPLVTQIQGLQMRDPREEKIKSLLSS